MKRKLLSTSVAMLVLWATVSSSLSYEHNTRPPVQLGDVPENTPPRPEDAPQEELTERENHLEDIPDLPHDEGEEIRETSSSLVDTRSTSNLSVSADSQIQLQPSVGQLQYAMGHLQASVGQIITSMGQFQSAMGHLQASVGQIITSVDRLKDKGDQQQSELKKTVAVYNALLKKTSTIESKVEEIQQNQTALKSDTAQSFRNSATLILESAKLMDSAHRLESELASFHNNMSLEHKQMSDILSRCPLGWTEFSGACYVLREVLYTWDNAQSACRSMNENLVTINNEPENVFVTQLARGESVWIGLTDKLQEGTWIWVDHQRPSYVKWLSGQPDNAGGNEDCVHMWQQTQGGWNDDNCMTTKYFVCKSSAPQ